MVRPVVGFFLRFDLEDGELTIRFPVQAADKMFSSDDFVHVQNEESEPDPYDHHTEKSNQPPEQLTASDPNSAEGSLTCERYR